MPLPSSKDGVQSLSLDIGKLTTVGSLMTLCELYGILQGCPQVKHYVGGDQCSSCWLIFLNKHATCKKLRFLSTGGRMWSTGIITCMYLQLLIGYIQYHHRQCINCCSSDFNTFQDSEDSMVSPQSMDAEGIHGVIS
ncbi:uncharacterized protein LOC126701437 isoform X2 [Quercus robur]|uniref:uncharacterized protein LOC126701437 isoform X2 n=1 Tax=Quercus robur TaxID=38942 RepID=UPI0021616854|nr:uncharacterized protein LOC126701437 isoform X2 [Quercus robur]